MVNLRFISFIFLVFARRQQRAGRSLGIISAQTSCSLELAARLRARPRPELVYLLARPARLAAANLDACDRLSICARQMPAHVGFNGLLCGSLQVELAIGGTFSRSANVPISHTGISRAARKHTLGTISNRRADLICTRRAAQRSADRRYPRPAMSVARESRQPETRRAAVGRSCEAQLRHPVSRAPHHDFCSRIRRRRLPVVALLGKLRRSPRSGATGARAR